MLLGTTVSLSSIFLCQDRNIRHRESVGLLQTASHGHHRGQPAPEHPGVLHVGLSHQHTLPGCQTGFRSCIVKGKSVCVCAHVCKRAHAGQSVGDSQIPDTVYAAQKRFPSSRLKSRWCLFLACSQDERWTSVFDPKLAALLSELELGLGSVVRQSGAQQSKMKRNSEEDVLGKQNERQAGGTEEVLEWPECLL